MADQPLNLYYFCPSEITAEVVYEVGGDKIPADWEISCDGTIKGQPLEVPEDIGDIELVLVNVEGTAAWDVRVTGLNDEEAERKLGLYCLSRSSNSPPQNAVLGRKR